MDVLGLTFSEAVERTGASAADVPRLRKAYARAMRGEADGGPFRADVLPVVRHVSDGDLTKFVQRTHDGLETETVIVPMRGKDRSWKTLCVSSQIGCAMGCVFCETGQLGFIRNLTAAEIVGQLLAARRLFGGNIRNVVFMGMGEPLDNFDAVAQAVRVLSESSGPAIAKGRIAISTVGRVNGIRRLAALGWRRINLAVSLNAPNDEVRSRIMPINRVEPMRALRRALLEFPLRRCGAIMIEYVLIPGVNDAREHAGELADYLRGIRCCVNVIPYNPRHDSPWEAPTEKSVVQFLDWLTRAGQYCKRRVTKGRDHMAACGQLGNRELVRTR